MGSSPSTKPLISVVVAVVHPGDLAATVAALARQTLPFSAFEVIVVDGLRIEDWRARLPEVVRATGRPLDYSFHVAPSPARGISNNIGVAHARADLVLFDADDFVLAPGAVEAHLRFHQAHPDPCAVGIGPGFFPASLRGDAFREWLEDSGALIGVSFTSGRPAIPPDFFYVGNASVKRSLLEQAGPGPFDPDFPHDAWEDYELGLRLSKLGMRATYLPDAAATHEHQYTLTARRTSMRNAGGAAAILERKYPGAHAWQAQCQIAPWRHRAAALGGRAAYLLTGRPEHRAAYFDRTLSADFVRGYRMRRRASAAEDARPARR